LLGLIDELGLIDGDSDEDGEMDSDGDIDVLGLIDALGDTDGLSLADGLIDGLSDELGDIEGDSLELGEKAYIRFDHTLAEPKPERYFTGPRLLLRELISRQFRLQAAKADSDFVTNKSMQSILQIPAGPDLSFILAILNSRLMSWYFLSRSNVGQRDDFPKIVLKETRSLPIRPVDPKKSPQTKAHDRMVNLVDSMLALHKQLAAAKSAAQKAVIQRQIDANDREIDRLVYDLYGLTKDEIAIVEGAKA
jgi:hypothetical protein